VTLYRGGNYVGNGKDVVNCIRDSNFSPGKGGESVRTSERSREKLR